MKKHKLFIVEFRDSSMEAKVYARDFNEAREKATLMYKSANFGRVFTIQSEIPSFIIKQPSYIRELYETFDFHKTIFICKLYDIKIRVVDFIKNKFKK